MTGASRVAARNCAKRLVDTYFPNLDSRDYETRFRSLAEEARHFFGIEVSALAGEPLDRMAELLEQGLLARLEGIRSRLGDEAFQSLAQSLLLECGDRCWREHLTDLQQAVASSSAGGHYHKGAVADYILHSRNMWEEFQAKASGGSLLQAPDFSTGIAGRKCRGLTRGRGQTPGTAFTHCVGRRYVRALRHRNKNRLALFLKPGDSKKKESIWHQE